MSELQPAANPSPSESKRIEDVDLAHDMANASTEARYDATFDRATAKYGLEGSADAQTSAALHPVLDEFANRQEIAVQQGNVPEAYTSATYIELRRATSRLMKQNSENPTSDEVFKKVASTFGIDKKTKLL